MRDSINEEKLYNEHYSVLTKSRREFTVEKYLSADSWFNLKPVVVGRIVSRENSSFQTRYLLIMRFENLIVFAI